MLQISTGKFFEGEAHETLRRVVYYTNYQVFQRNDRLETPAGSLQPAIGTHGLCALIGEIVERIEKLPGGPYAGEIVATGGDTLINDFAAVVSFALNITCTNDLELARRLVASERPSLGMDLVPQKYIPRMFDGAVSWKPDDAEYLNQFVCDLMRLDRKSYEGAIRAIRRYVIAAHRISDDVNLAYALFVMSIESLAQKFDGFEPAWKDYDETKRQRIDSALREVDETVAETVRTAVLANEHVAIRRRFCEFTLAHVGSTFFREEAEKVSQPISRPDLSLALKQAYSIRSSYVHHLKEIPRLLVGIPGFHETIEVKGQPALTFAGIARVARHVIKTFVAKATKVESEEFDWRKELPGQLTMQMAPQTWLDNPHNFNNDTAKKYLEGFISQTVAFLLNPSKRFSDIRRVLAQVEIFVPGLDKPAQRLPMLALYFLYNSFVPEDYRSASYQRFIDRYTTDFDPPSIVSLATHLLTGQNPDWSLSSMEDLYRSYFQDRHHAKTLTLGRMLEAAFTLRLAEQNRTEGNSNRARELIADAVEIFPGHAGLTNFEISNQVGDLNSIDWQAILLPARTA